MANKRSLGTFFGHSTEVSKRGWFREVKDFPILGGFANGLLYLMFVWECLKRLGGSTDPLNHVQMQRRKGKYRIEWVDGI